MSKFRKMKLVDISDKRNDNRDERSSSQNALLQTLNLSTPVNISRMNDNINNVKNILESDLNDRQKAILYSQFLKKFLTFKKKNELRLKRK